MRSPIKPARSKPKAPAACPNQIQTQMKKRLPEILVIESHKIPTSPNNSSSRNVSINKKLILIESSSLDRNSKSNSKKQPRAITMLKKVDYEVSS